MNFLMLQSKFDKLKNINYFIYENRLLPGDYFFFKIKNINSILCWFLGTSYSGQILHSMLK